MVRGGPDIKTPSGPERSSLPEKKRSKTSYAWVQNNYRSPLSRVGFRPMKCRVAVDLRGTCFLIAKLCPGPSGHPNRFPARNKVICNPVQGIRGRHRKKVNRRRRQRRRIARFCSRSNHSPLHVYTLVHFGRTYSHQLVPYGITSYRVPVSSLAIVNRAPRSIGQCAGVQAKHECRDLLILRRTL